MNKLIIAACAVLLVTNVAEAKNSGKLPKDAVPMATEEIKQILSGNSVDYKVVKYYFAVDGSVLGINRKKTSFADGSWTVTGNTWCLAAKWHGSDKATTKEYAQCEEKYKVGKKIYSKQVKGEDKYLGDISTDQEKKMKKGDIVSASVTALKKKLGYE